MITDGPVTGDPDAAFKTEIHQSLFRIPSSTAPILSLVLLRRFALPVRNRPPNIGGSLVDTLCP